MKINNRPIGRDHRPYVIAEISNNHLGDLDRACRLIEAAAKTGADAVKIQTYDADALTIDSNRPEFLICTPPWEGLNYYQLYKQIALPKKFTKKLFSVASDCGITLFSSPFDESAVALLQDLDCPAYKIASFEMCDDSLLRSVASANRPVLVSTGVANMNDIKETIQLLRREGCNEIGLFHCVSEYPADVESMNLRALDSLSMLGCEIGLSDHSLPHLASTVAVARGAVIIEKHFTLSRSDGGPDSSFSLEPSEFNDLVRVVNLAWATLGSKSILDDIQRPGAQHARSLFVVSSVSAGQVITADHVRAIRPGLGLPPRKLHEVIGRRARCDIERGTPLSWLHLE